MTTTGHHLRQAVRTWQSTHLLAEMVREMPAFRTTEFVFVLLNEAAFPGNSRRTATTGLLAVLAAALAAVGLYSVLSFAVSTRRRDLAIRIALGATRREMVAAAVSRASVAMAVGLTGGVAAAAGLGRFASSLLFGVRPADPWVLATAVLMALCIGVAAGVGPAVRAMKTPPAMALRE